MFVLIRAIFINYLVNNNLIALLIDYASLFPWNVPKQKVSGKDFDGFINKMGTLVINQSEGTIEPSQNEFVNELNYDCNHVGP